MKAIFGMIGQRFYDKQRAGRREKGLVGTLKREGAKPLPSSSSGLFGMKWSSNMDFKEAIQSHLAWTWRLKGFIRGRELLDPDSVAQDDQCPLGKWIDGAGQQYEHFDEFAELRELHAEFHRRAARIVRIAASGDTTTATKRLEFGGEFRNVSNQLVETLHRLAKKTGAEIGQR